MDSYEPSTNMGSQPPEHEAQTAFFGGLYVQDPEMKYDQSYSSIAGEEASPI